MPTLVAAAVPDSLADLPPLLRTADGFEPLAAALRAGRSGAVDGAWGSSAALAVAALVAKRPARFSSSSPTRPTSTPSPATCAA